MDNNKKKELKRLSNEIKPMFHLGKNGITNTFIETVDKYLKAHQIVKIKCLISTDKDSMQYYSQEIAKEVRAEIIDLKGFNFVLFRESEDD